MKALILSDSHGSFNAMVKAVSAEKDIDMIIHAGDVVRDVEDLKIMYPEQRIVHVKGNNDLWERGVEDDLFFTFGGVKIFVTHGHNYGVKYTLAKLNRHAVNLGADLCIFGHTHSALCEEQNGVIMFNPGTAVRSYGVLETKDGKPYVRICEN